MFFAGALGIAPIDVGATAAAACGASPNACGVFPLAFSKDLWDDFVIPNECGERLLRLDGRWRIDPGRGSS